MEKWREMAVYRVKHSWEYALVLLSVAQWRCAVAVCVIFADLRDDF